MKLSNVLKSYRLLWAANKVAANIYTDILSTNRIIKMSSSKVFAQRSITSFFTKNVLKEESTSIGGSRGSSFQKNETQMETDDNMKQLQNNKSPKNEIAKDLKRQRVESSESETETLTSPKIKSEKKKKYKKLCIESSDESESSASDNAPADAIVKQEKKSPIRSSPDKRIKADDIKKKSLIKSSPDRPIKKEKTKKKSPIKSSPDKPIKVEDTKKKSPIKSSPDGPLKVEETKKSSPILIKESKSLKPNNESPKDKKLEPTADGLVDYNPAKSRYHPVEDACWSAGEAVPYLALTRTLDLIEGTSARLKIIDILANYFRSVIALTPEDLLPSVYMCLNKLAPAYHSLELGIAETYLMKAVGQCTGQSVSQVRGAARRAGDLGAAAAAARGKQRTMFKVTPLTARKVFAALKEIANMTGHASVSKKINKIQSLFVACKHSEAKFLIRSLEGKLRIGLAEQSVLQALAVATALTPPHPDGVTLLDASKGLSPEAFKSVVEKNALTIKTTYCECPNYELVIPALLQHGVPALPHHCRLTVGIPLKPMLAHPTKGVHEVFNRFEGSEFTCEWKYDGERAQIHVPGESVPDLAGAAVFSRNQENNTSKYPDILRRLPALLKQSVSSCILDCEAVAYDTQNKQILPFQILSTRKRKDASEADIKVQVCVFIFDLLYLNGSPLVREPFAERRRLLREHFNVVEGEWQLATSRDCSSMEEVQAFLEESVKGSCEGLMVKTLTGDHAHYDIARRSRNWLKLKKDYLEGVGDTIDVVIIGAYFGRGKRHKQYGGFLAAARDAHSDTYQALCKLGTGFSDENLQLFTDTLEKMVIPAPRSYYSYDPSHTPDVWVEARAVWEVRCADLSLSPAHRAAIGLVDCDKGISLRFPRFVRVRDDKSPEQATSAQQIAEMYLAQDQVKNQLGKKDLNYDDFY